MNSDKCRLEENKIRGGRVLIQGGDYIYIYIYIYIYVVVIYLLIDYMYNAYISLSLSIYIYIYIYISWSRQAQPMSGIPRRSARAAWS